MSELRRGGSLFLPHRHSGAMRPLVFAQFVCFRFSVTDLTKKRMRPCKANKIVVCKGGVAYGGVAGLPGALGKPQPAILLISLAARPAECPAWPHCGPFSYFFLKKGCRPGNRNFFIASDPW